MIPDVATDIIVQIIKNIIDNIGKTDENKNIIKFLPNDSDVIRPIFPPFLVP